MSRQIVSISYLKEYVEDGKAIHKRHRCHSSSGMFFLITKCAKKANGRVQMKLSAYDFIINEDVSNGDPFLTLCDGYKLRVFQGGDKTYMLAEAKSLIELHDLTYATPKKKDSNKTGSAYEHFDFDEYDFPWPGIP